MPILKVHRLLIGSGIAVCLLYAVRQLLDYLHASAAAALMRALFALAGALALGLYLYSIRSQ
ncbi:MAG: hypothetical protein KatS3mg131_1827 [Candidatus Tectimicrobiota bacterium]|nr:MAG: hypothetical protein KatS3mg131_1827 [Candidatus Tectomicrobia bacterium]